MRIFIIIFMIIEGCIEIGCVSMELLWGDFIDIFLVSRIRVL